MSAPLQKTLHDLADASRMLDEAVAELAIADTEAVYAKNDYEQAYARSFMGLDGSMELRKQQTILDTAQESLECDLAEARVRALKERIRKLHAQIEMLRTVNAAQRAQFVAEPIGQYT